MSAAAPASTRRSFSLGQRALDAHDTRAAVEHLTRAAEADPSDGRIRCWLGMALADAGQLDEADCCFAEATALRDGSGDLPPRSGAVFPLMRGLAWLDAGQLDRAREHLDDASSRAPQNDLVRASLVLWDWDAGEGRDPDALLAGLELMPRRHQARVLVRLAEHVRRAGRAHDTPTGLAAGGLAGWQTRREHRRSERLLAQAERLADQGRLRPCLDTLRDVQPMDAGQRRRQHELFADVARRRIAEWRRILESDKPQGSDRADLLFRMVRLLREAGEDTATAQLACEWLTLYDDLGAPDDLRDDALDALSCVAAGALLADDTEAAEQALTRAFGMRTPAPGEVHRVRAHLALRRGDLRAARHDFEDWLAGFPLTPEYAWQAAAP